MSLQSSEKTSHNMTLCEDKICCTAVPGVPGGPTNVILTEAY